MRTRRKSAEPKVQLGSTSGEVKFKELVLIPAFLHECFVDLEIKRQLFSQDAMTSLFLSKKKELPTV